MQIDAVLVKSIHSFENKSEMCLNKQWDILHEGIKNPQVFSGILCYSLYVMAHSFGRSGLF